MAQGMRVNRMKKIGVFFAICAALLLGAMGQTSYALQYKDQPDILVEGIRIFSNTPNSVTVYGDAIKYNSLAMEKIYSNYYGSYISPYFDLFATLNNSAINGQMSIYADNDDTGTYTNGDRLYLSGDLTQLIFAAGDPSLEFIFTPTDGEYKSYYGALGGIILGLNGSTGNALVDGIYQGNFSNDGGRADVKTVAPVPEPSTVVLFLVGAGSLCFLKRRKL